MAKQSINIGTSVNSGTGDQLRTAFDKVNDNFTELYDTFPVVQANIVDAIQTGIGADAGAQAAIAAAIVDDILASSSVVDALALKASLASSPVFTGLVTASGLRSSYSVGDQGGEFTLAIPASGTSLSGPDVVFDSFQDVVRFFESGGTSRGWYLPIASGSAGAGANIIDRANHTGTLAVADGGTGATTQAAARTNLGLGTSSVQSEQWTVVTDYSDGSGSAANDDAAIDLAITAALASGKAIKFTRPFKVITEHTIANYMTIDGADTTNCYLTAEASIRSFFNLTNGLITVGHIFFDGKVARNASAAIRVDKAFNNIPVKIKDIDVIRTAADGIAWINGDVPKIDGVRGIDVPMLLNFYNNGMNGDVRDISQLGGAGLRIAKTTQQMEGTDFYNVSVLPGSATISHAVRIECGLSLAFYGLLVDQIAMGTAVSIEGTAAVPVSEIDIYGLWCGVSTVPVPAANMNGLACLNATQGVRVWGGTIYGFTGYGVAWSGNPAIGYVTGASVSGVKMYNNNCDLFAAYSRGALMHNRFESTANGIYEVVDVETDAFGNYFGTGPQAILAKSQYLANRGPGAFRGIPSASTGLVAGQMWYDAGASNTVKMI